MKFNDLAAFVSVTRAGGFRDAARISGVCASSLSIASRASMAHPLSIGAFMVVSQSAGSIAMQVMLQGAGQGVPGTAGLTALEALALVAAEAATAPQVSASANGMIGSIVNTFA
jgi:hypothetical protein